MTIADTHINHRLRLLGRAELAEQKRCEGGQHPCPRLASYLHEFDVEPSASRPGGHRARLLCHTHAKLIADRVPDLRYAALRPPSQEREALDDWERATGLRSGY